MYSQQAWGGPVDPFILIKFTDVGKEQQGDPVVSMVVFEWRDEDLIGIRPSPGATQVRLTRPPVLYLVLGLIPRTETRYLRAQVRRSRILQRDRYWPVPPGS